MSKLFRLIHTSDCKTYRIVEKIDETYRVEDILGDCYKPEVNSEIDAQVLERDRRRMIERIYNDGVWGYELEKWNPEPDHGWEHVDSCWGFVGQYVEGAEDYDHYIIAEMIDYIKRSTAAV